MLDLSSEIRHLKIRIAEAEGLLAELTSYPSFEFDTNIQASAAVQTERIERLKEMLDFCYNLLGD